MKAQPIGSLEDSCAFANVLGQEKRHIGRSNLTIFSLGVTIDYAVNEGAALREKACKPRLRRHNG